MCRMATIGGLLAIILLMAGCVSVHKEVSTVPAKGISTGFLNKTMSVDGHERKYVVYVPSDYDPAKRYPLIVFLHGMGERGDDGLLQSEVGIGRAIRLKADLYPCIVVMPQCPKDKLWVTATKHIETAMQRTESEYRIDKKRVYLTGLSMGGFGSWFYGAQHPDQFAAVMPICGGGKTSDAAQLAKLPIWAFHGGADHTVNPKASKEMVEAVKQAGGNIQYTEYPGVDHNSWDQTYTDARVVEWLFSQKRP